MAAKRGFASDNSAGVHPDVFRALLAVNQDHVYAYGMDDYTLEVDALFKKYFHPDCVVYYTATGIAANVLSIRAMIQSYHAVLSSDIAHVYDHECAALENFAGCKMIGIPHDSNGKLTVAAMQPFLHGKGDDHFAQPKMISLSQATEMGTVYQLDEIRQIVEFAHQHDMYVHMDGARLANAAVSLNCDLATLTSELQVDIFSFGGTKNGIMYGEAIIFNRPELAKNFRYIRKQGMQTLSKMRFVAAQFRALLTDHLWQRNAAHANQMAQQLAVALQQYPHARILYPVETNMVFCQLPLEIALYLQKYYSFYILQKDEEHALATIRLVCSFDTLTSDVTGFINLLQQKTVA
jgi:threonine aldolase